MLFFTGFSRFASEIAQQQIENTPNKKRELSIMHQMVNEAVSILNSNSDITEFGQLLDESWKLKKSLSNKISTYSIDEIYEAARDAGAIGGKLLGAGGGGFMLLFVRPEDQPAVRTRLKDLLHVPFNFETQGSQIVVYQPDITFRRQEISIGQQEISFDARGFPLGYQETPVGQQEFLNG
jgi:D-glycero-alpha-D-manno-heptose-7-phosphate kinase